MRRSKVQWHDFSFFVDLTDGTRRVPALYERFGLPILVLSRSHADVYTLPLPDPHFALGVLAASGLSTIIPEAVLGFAQGRIAALTPLSNLNW